MNYRRNRSVENQFESSQPDPMERLRSSIAKNSTTLDLKNIIKSTVRKENIGVCEFTPDKSKREETKFRCSIWYTFFSDILECSVCKNYIWVFDVEKFLIAVNSPTCPFWSSSPVVFTDVQRSKKLIKHYFSPSVRSKGVRSITEERKSFYTSKSQGKFMLKEDGEGYWKSHRNFENPIKFVAVNSLNSERKESINFRKNNDRIKIMALDPSRQTLTPMWMNDVAHQSNKMQSIVKKYAIFLS